MLSIELQNRGFCVLPPDGFSYLDDHDRFCEVMMSGGAGANEVEGPCLNGCYGVTFSHDERTDDELRAAIEAAFLKLKE